MSKQIEQMLFDLVLMKRKLLLDDFFFFAVLLQTIFQRENF